MSASPRPTVSSSQTRGRKIARDVVVRLAAAILSGGLFALSLPPRLLGFVAWFAFVPLLWASARTVRALHAFGLGMLCGLTAGFLYVGVDGRELGGASMQYAYTPFIWLALVLGAASTAASIARRRWPNGGVPSALFIASSGVVAEWLTAFSPLPVGVALTQSPYLPVIQIASVTGVWGVSWLLYLVNAALIEVLLTGKQARLSVGIATAALAVALLFGVRSVRGVQEENSRRKTVRVAAVQDYNGSDGGLDAPASLPDLPNSDELFRRAATGGAELIVGTEEALGVTFQPENANDAVYKQARDLNAHLVVGFESRDQPMPYNCAALVSPQGQTLGVHHKIQLFLGERQAMRAGTSAAAYPTPLGKIGLLICFDSCFTAYARQSTQAGANLLAVPNFDPPTPHAVLHHLHAALMPFRAVENRVSLVRAEPGGLSQIVDPTGRVLAVAPMYRPAVVCANVPLGNNSGTLFTRLGDWFAWGSVAFVLWGLWQYALGSNNQPTAGRAGHEATAPPKSA